jgi:DNA-binding response OmpR family regulator
MQKPNVLIIEDEIFVQRMYLRIFKDADVSCVASGEEAINLIRDNPSKWDLIISDQVLAGRIPGRDIYLHLVEYHPHLSKRFIFATRSYEELEGLDIAPSRVLPKPFEGYQIVNLARGVQRHEHQAI